MESKITFEFGNRKIELTAERWQVNVPGEEHGGHYIKTLASRHQAILIYNMAMQATGWYDVLVVDAISNAITALNK